MFEFVKHLWKGTAPFASSGVLLMLAGGAGVSLRTLPAFAWEKLVDQTTLTVTVKDEDAAFQWVKEWFLEQEFLKRIRRVDLDTTMRGTELALLPAPGIHLFWRRGRPFWVWFHRSDETKGRAQRRTESLTFQTIGRRQAALRDFVDEIVTCHRRRECTSSSLYVYDDFWTNVQAYSPRLLESIVLDLGEKERLVDDLQRFRAARGRYRQLGVPYHRGYLLYGPPGTGKTSLVSGLAAHFGMSIYALNLTEMNDRTLKSAMNEVPENSVILFEDIDCMRAGHRRGAAKAPVNGNAAAEGAQENCSGVTLSGLLNVLDGFHAPENVVYVMTTNDADALDPALLRPGRIDYKLHMGPAGETQKVELYLRFFPGATLAQATHFAISHAAQTMAEFQGLLLRLDREGMAETEAECALV